MGIINEVQVLYKWNYVFI